MKHVRILGHVLLILKDLVNQEVNLPERLLNVINLKHLHEERIPELILGHGNRLLNLLLGHGGL